MKVVYDVFALVRVAGWILFNFLRLVRWILSIYFAYVDWPRLWSMDFDFNWGDSEQGCGVFDILSNLNEFLLDPDEGTLREMYEKCLCKRVDCMRMPPQFLKKLRLPPDVGLVQLALTGNWMFFFVSLCFRICGIQSPVPWIKACFRSDGVQSRVAWIKTCFRSDGVQSRVACVKTCSLSDAGKSKLSDEDFNKIVLAIQNAMYKPSHAFHERLKGEMSNFLLCIPNYAMGTKWISRYIDENDSDKGIEITNPALLRMIRTKQRRLSGKEWTAFCIGDITETHYVKDGYCGYYPSPLIFGRKEDLESILGALKDDAFRVELEKKPDLCRDILAVHAQH